MKISAKKDKKLAKKEYDRQYYLANKTKYDLRVKKWMSEHLEEYRLKSRERTAKHRLTPKGVYTNLLRSAKKRGLDICQRQSFVVWHNSIKKTCAYCDIPVELVNKFDPLLPGGRPNQRLTVDRIDPKVGYVMGNMTLACFRCNATKSDFFNSSEMRILAQQFIKPRWQRFQ